MSKELIPCPSSAMHAGEFVARLQRYAITSHAADHPLLAALGQGAFHDLRGALRRFLREYYVYSRNFTRYLGAVMSNLESSEHRALLSSNAAEEAGLLDACHAEELRRVGIDPEAARAPHPELYRRFLRAIEIDPDTCLRTPPHLATQVFCETFHDICRFGGQGQSIGALGIATEGIVRQMYGRLLAAIARAWPSLPPRDRVFFDLHATVDDDHARVLLGIAQDMAEVPEGRRQLALGTLKALQARAAFFDQMMMLLRGEDASEVPASRC